MEDKLFYSRIKPRWLSTLFVLVWTVLCVGMIGVLIYGTVETPSRLEEVVVVCLLLMIAILGAINYMRWQFTGRENIVFTDTNVVVYRSGTWFAKKLMLTYEEIEGVELLSENQSPFLLSLYGFRDGKIV